MASRSRWGQPGRSGGPRAGRPARVIDSCGAVRPAVVGQASSWAGVAALPGAARSAPAAPTPDAGVVVSAVDPSGRGSGSVSKGKVTRVCVGRLRPLPAVPPIPREAPCPSTRTTHRPRRPVVESTVSEGTQITTRNPPPGTPPGLEPPGPEPPGTEIPGTEIPGTEIPGTEIPGTDTPGTDTPGTETPGTKTPGRETPGTETPGTKTPGTDTPGT
jgi:hypothetical protein